MGIHFTASVELSLTRRRVFEKGFHALFYVRSRDLRARIVCKFRRPDGPSDYFMLALNMLEISRSSERSLKLCRRRKGGELVIWANFNFRTYEGMH